VGQELITVASHLEKPLMPAKWLGSHMFYQVWCSRGKDVLMLKAVFQPRHSLQVCGTAFKVDQHCGGCYGVGKVPENPVVPLSILLGRNAFRAQSGQEALVHFQSSSPSEIPPLTGEP